MLKRLLLLYLLVMLAVATPLAATEIAVLALFKNKALVEIDGAQVMLRQGQSRSGVKLIQANSRQAILEVDGKRGTYKLGQRISGSYSEAQQVEVQIWRQPGGMFTTTGSINGRPVGFLVDTGASAVAVSSREAKRLGIDYRERGVPIQVATASGNARGYRLTLDQVRVGQIQLYQVEALVIDGSHPQPALLGQTFLNRLEIENNGRLMLLRQTK